MADLVVLFALSLEGTPVFGVTPLSFCLALADVLTFDI